MSHEGLIFILPAAIAIRLLRKRTGDVIDPSDLWVPCWRNLHPRWLLIYHAFSFLAVAFYLYQTVAEFGFFVFFFYTHGLLHYSWSTLQYVVLFLILSAVNGSHDLETCEFIDLFCKRSERKPIQNGGQDKFLNRESKEETIFEQLGFLENLMQIIYLVNNNCEIKLQAVTMEKDRGKSINKPSNEKITLSISSFPEYPLSSTWKSGAEISLSMSGVDEKFGKCLWCGDVTVDRLKWGNEFLKTRMGAKSNFDVSPETLRRVQRVKQLTAMSERVATGLLSGVVKVSGFFTSSVANSKVGQKFFSLLPGEIVLGRI
ncbi:hypothetical protein CASFOL_039073 [Castilleja foliolosa]|uniref:Senescence domain-containing protein n=1 Tax=Castilleja foliolosa TaxID=1961234 RepID=A0ABD3BHC6_9LAMI